MYQLTDLQLCKQKLKDVENLISTCSPPATKASSHMDAQQRQSEDGIAARASAVFAAAEDVPQSHLKSRVSPSKVVFGDVVIVVHDVYSKSVITQNIRVSVYAGVADCARAAGGRA